MNQKSQDRCLNALHPSKQNVSAKFPNSVIKAKAEILGKVKRVTLPPSPSPSSTKNRVGSDYSQGLYF